ncbi:hypothetical protein [Salmonella phage SD-1_S14]|nr:hypothetical protein [Salmonella phage SD-1_S14]
MNLLTLWAVAPLPPYEIHYCSTDILCQYFFINSFSSTSR